jgi:hypothetical protein
VPQLLQQPPQLLLPVLLLLLMPEAIPLAPLFARQALVALMRQQQIDGKRSRWPPSALVQALGLVTDPPSLSRRRCPLAAQAMVLGVLPLSTSRCPLARCSSQTQSAS